MSFRYDKPVSQSKKVHRCEWCPEEIQPFTPHVKISGKSHEGDFFFARMHCECWRAEHAEYWKNDEDCWPEDRMERGSCYTGLFYSDLPVCKQEIDRPGDFTSRMIMPPVFSTETPVNQ